MDTKREAMRRLLGKEENDDFVLAVDNGETIEVMAKASDHFLFHVVLGLLKKILEKTDEDKRLDLIAEIVSRCL